MALKKGWVDMVAIFLSFLTFALILIKHILIIYLNQQKTT